MNQKRVVIYMNEDEHKKVKSKLALMGLSVSEWFRRLVKEFVDGE